MRAVIAAGIVLALVHVVRAAPDAPIAITGARLERIAGPAIERGTVVIENGKITAVGPAGETEVPPGAERIDARGRTLLPGLVNPFTQVGLASPRATGGTNPHLSPVPGLDPRSRSLRDALRAGFTTLAVTREGSGIPGTGVVIRPVGRTVEDLVVAEGVYLRMSGATGTRNLKPLRDALLAAKKEVDAVAKYEKDRAAYEKALEEAKRKEAEAKKKGEKPPEPPKLEEPKAPSPNPRTEAVRRAVRGEIPVFVRIGTATELLHFLKVPEGLENLRIVVLFTGSDGYRIGATLAERKWPVVLRPSLETTAYTQIYRNVPAELAKLGVRFAMHPYPDNGTGHEDIYLSLGVLVRAGLSRDRALRAVTLDAAALLGLEKRLGSLEADKDANLVIFSGDPLDPRTRVEQVILEGEIVHPDPEDLR